MLLMNRLYFPIKLHPKPFTASAAIGNDLDRNANEAEAFIVARPISLTSLTEDIEKCKDDDGLVSY